MSTCKLFPSPLSINLKTPPFFSGFVIINSNLLEEEFSEEIPTNSIDSIILGFNSLIKRPKLINVEATGFFISLI